MDFSDKLLKQIEFIKEIDKIKYIQRKTKLFNSDRPENANQSVDLLKVIKMVLIHDIVEIDAGDTFIYDTEKNHTNTEVERLAAQRIFGILPAEQAEELIALWEEFEAGQTHDAQFARAMDRLEPLLQNSSNNGGTWNEPGVNYEKVYAKKSVIKDGSAVLWGYAEKLIDMGVMRGILKKD